MPEKNWIQQVEKKITPSEINTLLDKAVSYHKSGQYQLAENYYRQLLLISPKCHNSKFFLAMICQEKNELFEAEELFKNAARLAPGIAKYQLRLGNILLQQDKIDEALIYYQRTVELAPDTVAAYQNSGFALQKAGRLNEAESAFRQAIRLSPDNQELHNNLGSTLLSLKKLPEALSYFKKAISLNPKFAKAHYNHGITLFELSKFPEAEEAVRNALAITGNLEKYALLLAKITLNKEKNFQEAINFYRQSPENDLKGKNYFCKIIESSIMDSEKSKSGKPYFHVLTDVLVETMYWSIIDKEKFFVKETTNRNYDNSKFIRLRSADKKKFLIAYEKEHTLEEPCILIGSLHNYYHMLVDHITRLAIIEQEVNFKDLPLLITDYQMAPFFNQCLEMLKISPNRLIKVPTNSIIRCKKIVVPTMLTMKKSPMAMGVRWLRKKIMPEQLLNNRQGSKIIFISRAGVDYKKLINEEEIINSLEKFNIEVISPQDHSLTKQVEIFNQAKCIIGPHGTGLTNILWAPPGVKIIDLKGQFNHFKYIEALADSLGASYTSITGNSIIPENADTQNQYQQADFHIDPDLVCKCLDNCL
jgi:tetratricopeptide (TPR) repeat protein